MGRHLARQGHRRREGRHRGQAAELGHPKVLPRAADQERQEDRGLRALGWLPQFHRRERRGADRWLRSSWPRRRRYSRCALQGGEGCRLWLARFVPGEEGEAPLLSSAWLPG